MTFRFTSGFWLIISGLRPLSPPRGQKWAWRLMTVGFFDTFSFFFFSRQVVAAVLKKIKVWCRCSVCFYRLPLLNNPHNLNVCKGVVQVKHHWIKVLKRNINSEVFDLWSLLNVAKSSVIHRYIWNPFYPSWCVKLPLWHKHGHQRQTLEPLCVSPQSPRPLLHTI